jgi:hypothetical protein
MKRTGSVGPARSYRGADSSPRGRSTNITHLFIRRLDPPSRRRFPSEENPQGEFLPTARPSGDDACGRNVLQCRASSLGRRKKFRWVLRPKRSFTPNSDPYGLALRNRSNMRTREFPSRNNTSCNECSGTRVPMKFSASTMFRRQLIYLFAEFRNALQYLVP